LGNQRKLDAVERLSALADESGISLTHLALAFATTHPGVTSVILGARTVEQLTDQLAAAEVRLDDEIVAPGATLNPADIDYRRPALTDSEQRRRPARHR
jgi:aryl-alcohol dehydrogenase (NADP+)